VGTSPRNGSDATVQALRQWEYYGMMEPLTDLYDRATKQESFLELSL
jgi:hypothetical protein